MPSGWRAKLAEMMSRQIHPGRGMAERTRDRNETRRRIPYVQRWMTRADWTVGGVSLLAIALNIAIALQTGQEIEFGRAFAVIAGILLIFVIATAFFEVSLAKRARAASFRLCPRCLHDLSGGVAHEMKDETETTMTCPECAWSVRVGENSERWRKYVESPLPQARLLRALMRWGGW